MVYASMQVTQKLLQNLDRSAQPFDGSLERLQQARDDLLQTLGLVGGLRQEREHGGEVPHVRSAEGRAAGQQEVLRRRVLAMSWDGVNIPPETTNPGGTAMQVRLGYYDGSFWFLVPSFWLLVAG